MQNVDDDPYNNLLKNSETISNNYDILLKFHEVGMFSGKFPSNSKVELYNYEYDGVVIQNKLTSAEEKDLDESKDFEEKKKNVNDNYLYTSEVDRRNKEFIENDRRRQ